MSEQKVQNLVSLNNNGVLLTQEKVDLLNQVGELLLRTLSEQTEVKNSFFYRDPQFRPLTEEDWEVLLKNMKQRKYISYKAKERHLYSLTDKGRECVKNCSPEMKLFFSLPEASTIHLSEFKNLVGEDLIKEALDSALGQQIILLQKHPSSDPLLFRSPNYTTTKPRDRIKGLLETMTNADSSAWHLSRTEKQLLKRRDFIFIKIRKRFVISRGASFPYLTSIEQQIQAQTNRLPDENDDSEENENENDEAEESDSPQEEKSGKRRINPANGDGIKYVRFQRAPRTPTEAIHDIIVCIQKIQHYISALQAYLTELKPAKISSLSQDIDAETTLSEVQSLLQSSKEKVDTIDIQTSLTLDAINTNLINIGEAAGVLYNHNILPEVCWTRLIKRRNFLIHLYFNTNLDGLLQLVFEIVQLKPSLLQFLSGQTSSNLSN